MTPAAAIVIREPADGRAYLVVSVPGRAVERILLREGCLLELARRVLAAEASSPLRGGPRRDHSEDLLGMVDEGLPHFIGAWGE